MEEQEEQGRGVCSTIATHPPRRGKRSGGGGEDEEPPTQGGPSAYKRARGEVAGDGGVERGQERPRLLLPRTEKGEAASCAYKAAKTDFRQLARDFPSLQPLYPPPLQVPTAAT